MARGLGTLSSAGGKDRRPHDDSALRLLAAVDLCRSGSHANRCHHAAILVLENMAVIDEIAGRRATEIHADLDAWIWAASRPVGNLEGIEILTVAHRRAVLLELQKMYLMNMQVVGFYGAVLDNPVFDRP